MFLYLTKIQSLIYLTCLLLFAIFLLKSQVAQAQNQESDDAYQPKIINPLDFVSEFDYEGYIYQIAVSPKPDEKQKASLIIRKREDLDDDASTFREVYSSFLEIEASSIAKVRVYHATREDYRWRPSTTNLLLGEFDRKRGRSRFSAEGEKMQNRRIQGRVDFSRVMKTFEPAEFRMGDAVIATVEFFIMGYPGLLGR